LIEKARHAHAGEVNGGFIALTDAVDYSAGQGVTKGLHRGGVYKR
jgi:hypothetical protein